MSNFNVNVNEWSDEENRWLHTQTMTAQRALDIINGSSKRGKSNTLSGFSKRSVASLYITRVELEKRDGIIPANLAQAIDQEFGGDYETNQGHQ